jgi:hypothetical protein
MTQITKNRYSERGGRHHYTRVHGGGESHEEEEDVLKPSVESSETFGQDKTLLRTRSYNVEIVLKTA